MGHFEFSICDQKLGHSTADAQTCLNKHRLRRMEPPTDCVPNDARGDCQPVHEEYPERWYLPPGTGTYRMRFVIPSDLSCSDCTLQWRWWTANSCIPAKDYGCFYNKIMPDAGWNSSEWCGEYCGTCGGDQAINSNCGEHFRNCADIQVIGGSGGSPSPVAPSPSGPSPTSPVATPAPTPPPAAAGACRRNTDCVANAWCA